VIEGAARKGSAGISERLRDEVARGGAPFEAVVLTRNRRVMVSVGSGGRVLRLHEAFAEAPPEVLRAVGGLLSPTGSGRRAAARRAIEEFLVGVVPVARDRRPRRAPSTDQPHLQRLQEEFDRVNREHFGGALPRVPIFLSGRMRRRNGHFSVDPLEIVISRRLCAEASDGEAAATLRHEMIHLWQHMQGLRPGHGADFRRWAARLGVHPRAAREVAWRAG